MQLHRENEAWEVSTRLVSAPGATVNEWIQRARLAAAMRRREETKAAVESAAALTTPTDPLIVEVRKELNVSDPATALRQQRVIRQRTLIGVSVAFLLILTIILTSLTTSHVNNIAFSKVSLTQTASVRSAQTAVASDYATATAEALQPYTATILGNCQGSIINPNYSWQTGTDTMITCIKTGLKMVQPNNSKVVAVEFLDTLLEPFSYLIKSSVTNMSSNACALILTNGSVANNSFAAYGFRVCADGSWAIHKYDSSGKGFSINFGSLVAKATYSLSVESRPGSQIFDIDGTQVDAEHDASVDSYATTFVALGVDTSDGKSCSAVFSNFSFQPEQ